MDYLISINRMEHDPISDRDVICVERKGVGHPDSVCDGIAEAVSVRLSSWYKERFGRVLHHNTDKVQLVAGRSEPEFGGGDLLDPIHVIIGGRATQTYDGIEIPVGEIAVQAAAEYVDETFKFLDPDAVTFEPRIGETSAALRSLSAPEGVPKANDTSIGVGYAPLTDIERIVRSLPSKLMQSIPAVGEDVKLMGLETDEEVYLTVAAAVISRHVASLNEYLEVKARIKDFAVKYAEQRTERDVRVGVNTADDPEKGAVYLTETGTSAEMADDGMTGRGNRINGLITPYRPTSLEAVAGKNPVNHVGKLYNVLARQIAEACVEEGGLRYADVKLLSQIGAPITQPLVADIDATADGPVVRDIVEREIANVSQLTDRIIATEVELF